MRISVRNFEEILDESEISLHNSFVDWLRSSEVVAETAAVLVGETPQLGQFGLGEEKRRGQHYPLYALGQRRRRQRPRVRVERLPTRVKSLEIHCS